MAHSGKSSEFSIESTPRVNLDMKCSDILSQEQRTKVPATTHYTRVSGALVLNVLSTATSQIYIERKKHSGTHRPTKSGVFTVIYWGLFTDPESGLNVLRTL